MAKKKSKRTKAAQPQTEETDDLPPLSAKEIAELKRRIADLHDPTRYVIVSPFSRRFCLYYVPESGNYIMNEIPVEALFKLKSAAQALAQVLERGRPKRARKSLQVVAVKKTEGGVRFLEEVRDPWHKGQRWKPVLRRREKADAGKPSRKTGRK